MKHDIAGWYEIGQRWKLWKDGQLRDFYIDHIHVFESDDSDTIEVENVNVIDVEIAELAVFPQFPPLSDLIPPGWGFDLLVHRL